MGKRTDRYNAYKARVASGEHTPYVPTEEDEKAAQAIADEWADPIFLHGIKVGESFGEYNSWREANVAHKMGELELWLEYHRPKSMEDWDAWDEEHGENFSDRWKEPKEQENEAQE